MAPSVAFPYFHRRLSCRQCSEVTVLVCDCKGSFWVGEAYSVTDRTIGA